MHSATLTLEVLERSVKKGDYHFETDTFFRHLTDKDDDQQITLITSASLPQHCRLVNCTGVIKSTGFVDSVEFIAEDVYPVLVTPDWPGNKWANLEGLRKRQADITIVNDNLGNADNFRTGQTSSGTHVFNCSLASRRPQEILAGDVNAAPTWFDLSLWGKLGENYGPRLSGGQSVQYCYGKLSFRHWGDNGDRVSLQVSVRTFLPGRGDAMPNPDAPSEAPPTEYDPEADAQLEETEAVPVEAHVVTEAVPVEAHVVTEAVSVEAHVVTEVVPVETHEVAEETPDYSDIPM
jgi:single-stranded DNA-binding protein